MFRYVIDTILHHKIEVANWKVLESRTLGSLDTGLDSRPVQFVILSAPTLNCTVLKLMYSSLVLIINN